MIEDDPYGRFELLGDYFVGSHIEDFDVIEPNRNKVNEFQSEDSLDEFAKVRFETQLFLIAANECGKGRK